MLTAPLAPTNTNAGTLMSTGVAGSAGTPPGMGVLPRKIALPADAVNAMPYLADDGPISAFRPSRSVPMTSPFRFLTADSVEDTGIRAPLDADTLALLNDLEADGGLAAVGWDRDGAGRIRGLRFGFRRDRDAVLEAYRLADGKDAQPEDAAA